MKNNYASKTIRVITSILPIHKARNGSCKMCGECCKLPNPCMFLDYKEDDRAICKIYKFRPLNCRKYPRNGIEHMTKGVCGFYFEND